MRARTCTTNKNFVHCEILEHFFFLGSGWGPGLGSRAGAGLGLGLGLGWLGPGLGLASSTNFSTGGRARAINFDHKAFFCLVLLLCSKRSDCALFLCFSGAPKTQRCLYVCAFFCAFLVLFLVLETMRLCSFFVLFWFWCSKNQTCLYGCACFCAFLVLEAIRPFCFSSARDDPIALLFCAFLVLPKPNLFVWLCFFCAP